MLAKRTGVAAGLLALLLAGCVAKKDHELVVVQLLATRAENAALKATIAERDQALAAAEAEAEVAKKAAAEKVAAAEAQTTKLKTDLKAVQGALKEREAGATKELSAVKAALQKREADLAKAMGAAVELGKKLEITQQQLTDKLAKLTSLDTSLSAKAKALAKATSDLTAKDAALKQKDSHIADLMKQIEAFKKKAGGAVGDALKLLQK